MAPFLNWCSRGGSYPTHNHPDRSLESRGMPTIPVHSQPLQSRSRNSFKPHRPTALRYSVVMRLHVEPGAEALARKAARLVAGSISANPEIVLALPTGRSPLCMYAELVRIHRAEGLDFSRVRAFSLDEYLGVPATDPRSFHCYLWTHLLGQVNIRPENVRLSSGEADDAFCRQYEEDIRASGGMDLLIAGVGVNGHIAFNEPGCAFNSRTRIVELADSTIEHLRPAFSNG